MKLQRGGKRRKTVYKYVLHCRYQVSLNRPLVWDFGRVLLCNTDCFSWNCNQSWHDAQGKGCVECWGRRSSLNVFCARHLSMNFLLTTVYMLRSVLGIFRILFIPSITAAVRSTDKYTSTKYFAGIMHLLLLLHVMMAWITIRAIKAETGGIVPFSEVALSRGGGIEMQVRINRKRDGSDSLLTTPDCSVD